jgi:hypothetical protein
VTTVGGIVTAYTAGNFLSPAFQAIILSAILTTVTISGFLTALLPLTFLVSPVLSIARGYGGPGDYWKIAGIVAATVLIGCLSSLPFFIAVNYYYSFL